jgi:hypothetical protein
MRASQKTDMTFGPPGQEAAPTCSKTEMRTPDGQPAHQRRWPLLAGTPLPSDTIAKAKITHKIKGFKTCPLKNHMPDLL